MLKRFANMNSDLLFYNSSLPFIWTLPVSRRTLLVEEMTEERIPSAFQLVENSSKRGDNIGLDEFPTLRHVEDLLKRSTAFTFSNLSSRSLECLLIVEPCRYVRSYRPTLCTIYLVTSPELSSRCIWRELIQFVQDAARALPEVYSACVVDVFVTCTERMLAMREEGFLITACVPDAGKLEGHRGHVGNYIMYKDLRTLEAPKFVQVEMDDGEIGVFVPELKEMSSIGLPVSLTLDDGVELTMRPLRREEIRPFYDALKVAVNSNTGYGLDELPTFNFFVRYYVHNFTNFVFELKGSGLIVAYTNLGASSYSRSVSSRLTDSNIVIHPEFRSKGWLKHLSVLNLKLFKSGSNPRQGETVITNLASITNSIRMGHVVNGVLPKGIYFKDVGWMDLLLCYRPSIFAIATIPNAQNGNTRAKL